MPPAAPSKTIFIKMVVEPGFHDGLKALAESEHRSVRQQIVHIVSRELDAKVGKS